VGDALGSARQLTDQAGAVVLSRSYDPYGNVAKTNGTSTTAFGFTGEQQDVNGLTYLRARYYITNDGRFASRDTWSGDPAFPMSYNQWEYVEGNPINYVDPTGYIKENQAKAAWDIMLGLKQYQVDIVVDWGYADNGILRAFFPVSPEHAKLYGWGCLTWTEGEWSLKELQEVDKGVKDLAMALGSPVRFAGKMGGTIYVSQEDIGFPGQTFPPNVVKFRSIPKDYPESFSHWSVVHEFGHVWDFHYGNWLSNWLVAITGGYVAQPEKNCENWKRGCNTAGYYYGGIPAKGSDTNFNAWEDFAESVAAYMYPIEAQDYVEKYFKNTAIYYKDYKQLPRWEYIDFLAKH